jgi:ribosomal subunit interface protein
MPIPVDISFRDIDPSPAIEARILEKIAKLEEFYERAIACKVVVEARHHHHHKGRLYNVRIHLAIPGEDLLVGHEHKLDHAHEDVYVAIRDAFDALRRQLQDRVRRWQGETKLHVVPDHGRVARLFDYEGYGFIEAADGQEIYFHKNAVTSGFDKLEVGDEVRFVMQEGESEKGPQASTVTRLGKHHLPKTETTR